MPDSTPTQSHEAIMIDVKGLVKKYNQTAVVKGIDFQVRRGEIFGLLGPNGAGKTTTMEMIEGLRRPDGGTAIVAGYDTRKAQDKVKEVIGVQLQSTSLFELLTVEEIVNMYASFYKKSVPVAPLLEDILLKEKIHARVKGLSGGQKQRLAIALALVNDPKIVFLDEPTTGLDPQERRMLWDIILKMKEKGKTIVLSTHYMDEANILCDRICLMDQGSVVALDTPENLIRNLQSESAVQFRIEHHEQVDDARRQRFTEQLNRLEGVKHVSVQGDRITLYTDHLQEALVRFVELAETEQITFQDLQTRTATLEDVFIARTGRSLGEE
ncbi:MAG: ATP-binding cassette domain-containing protein [Bacillaceae bacterium]|nr:ATP-binding cassette domain-containing protein [Bacillaceae bacterium]